MKAKRSERRKFAHEWDEIQHLRDRLLYWLYNREDSRRAKPYAERLERLLLKADPDHEAILGEECWSLVYETRKDFPKAIAHRQREVNLIRQLHEIARNKEYEEIATKGYGHDDLSDRLNLLATLYHDSGSLEKAISALEESKQLCATHGIRFDGEDLLQEYIAERNARQGRDAM